MKKFTDTQYKINLDTVVEERASSKNIYSCWLSMMKHSINHFSTNLQTNQIKFNSQKVVLPKASQLTDSIMTKNKKIKYSFRQKTTSPGIC